MELEGCIRKPAEPLGHAPGETEPPLVSSAETGPLAPSQFILVRNPGNSLGSAPLSCVALDKPLGLSDAILNGWSHGGHASSTVVLGVQWG